MHVRSSRILLSLLTVLFAVGCTSASEGSPKPMPTGDTTAESDTSNPPSSDTSEPNGDDLPSDGAPGVENPLDISDFEQDPCKLLTSQEAQDLNVPQAQDKGSPDSKACVWSRSELGSGSLEADFINADRRGLSSLYRGNNRGNYAYFMELPEIEGYPAVAYDQDDLRNVTGRCFVSVGVADSNILTVLLGLSKANIGHKDPCALAADVAEMMLTKIKASQ